jgi:hypothetical protein
MLAGEQRRAEVELTSHLMPPGTLLLLNAATIVYKCFVTATVKRGF